MGLPPGKTNNPSGRPAGSKNKVSNDLKKWVLNLIDSNRVSFEKSLKKLSPKDQLAAMNILLSYTLPKPTELKGEITIKKRAESLTDDQLNMLIEQILKEDIDV